MRACRAEVVAYLRKVRTIVPGDLKFVIEDATEGDASKVGIMWWVSPLRTGVVTVGVLPRSHYR